MLAFLLIACVVFWLFGKFYTIARKRDAVANNQAHSTFVFVLFMVVCTVLWLAFKYAFKSTVLVLACLLLWPNIRKFADGLEKAKDGGQSFSGRSRG